MKFDALNKNNDWELLIDALFEPLLVLDLGGKILYANQAACQLFDKKKVDLIESDFSHPIELDKPTEIEIFHIDKEIVYADMYIRKGAWKNDNAFIVTLHDITSRKETEKKLNVLANVFTYAKEGILVTDSDLNIIDVNAEFTHITQYKKEEVIGKKPSILKSGIQQADFYKQMWFHLNRDGYWYGELWNKRKNNETYPQLLAISTVKNADGELVNYIGVFYDLTQQEIQKQQLIRMAYYDNLTNLPNRQLLMDRLETAIKNTTRSHNFIALVFIDIDSFKSVNDLYDHKTGDELLIQTAQLLENSIRATDTLARLGGDEFVILIEGLKNPYDYRYVMDKIFKNFMRPFMINLNKIFITISAGVSFYPQQTIISSRAFLSQADQAMYKSKISGKNKYILFDTVLDLELRNQEDLIRDMELAIQNNELKLYYQPKVNLKTGELLGLEGLIRWDHPKKGLLQPNQFLPTIKNVQFLFKLSELTIKLALNQLQLWSEIDNRLTISINVNALQLEQKNFYEKLKRHIKPYPKNIYRRLELEILESSIISRYETTVAIIKKCNKLGIRFSLDDFGTKYSSLNYLINLPLKYMKIDAEFIFNVINNKRDTKILKAILDIAKAIKIKVIAEGVETQEHMDYLMKIDCEFAQGYAISRPMPAEQFSEWYRSWNNKKCLRSAEGIDTK